MQAKKIIKYTIPICSICIDELLKELVITPCGHVFHTLCIYDLEYRKECPKCKLEINFDNIKPICMEIESKEVNWGEGENLFL